MDIRGFREISLTSRGAKVSRYLATFLSEVAFQLLLQSSENYTSTSFVFIFKSRPSATWAASRRQQLARLSPRLFSCLRSVKQKLREDRRGVFIPRSVLSFRSTICSHTPEKHLQEGAHLEGARALERRSEAVVPSLNPA